MKKLLFYVLPFVIWISIAVTELISQTQTDFSSVSNFREIVVSPDDNYQNKFLNKSEEILFTEHIILSNYNNACGIVGIDLNGDGNEDFVATSFDGGYVCWFENDGNQNFIQHQIISNFPQAAVVDVAHINSDEYCSKHLS